MIWCCSCWCRLLSATCASVSDVPSGAITCRSRSVIPPALSSPSIRAACSLICPATFNAALRTAPPLTYVVLDA
jgi:hypothetical protein